VAQKLAAFVLLAALTAGRASAEPVQLDFFDLPPYSYDQDGHPAGAAVTVAQSIIAGLDIAVRPELVPIRRLSFEAGKSPLIVAAIIRNAEREEHYQWIGRLCTDPFVFVTRAPNPEINSLDEARKVKFVAVVTGATNELYLRDHGFTNLDPAANIQLEVRRLAEGHDDTWFAPRGGALYAWKMAGYDPADLRFGAAIAPMAVWMAASKSVPQDLVETLRARFAVKVKDGTVAAVTGCPNPD